MDTSIGEKEESVSESWMICNCRSVLKMRFMKIGVSIGGHVGALALWKKANCPAHAATAHDGQEKEEESTKNREYPCVSSGSYYPETRFYGRCSQSKMDDRYDLCCDI